MKKRVFFLLVAALIMPFAMNAQPKSAVHVDTTVSACETYTWNVNGQTYTTTGAYTHISGDTLYILDLTINPAYNIVVPGLTHGGCSFTWGNTVYHQSDEGVQTQTFQSVNGCDSTVTINLVLADSAFREYTKVACSDYTWKGTKYTASGVYNVTDQTNPECDSILSLDLTIVSTGAPRVKDSVISACDNYRFRFNNSFRFPSNNNKAYIDINQDGTEFTTAYDGFDTSTVDLRNIFHPRSLDKCYDSVINFHFNIKNKKEIVITEKTCDVFSITINDTVYNWTSSIIDTVKAPKSVNGCDSLYYMHLTINKSPYVSISGDLRVTPGSSATLYANCDQQVNYKWFNNSTETSITLEQVNENTDVSLTGTNDSTGCSHTAYATIMANVGINGVDNDQLSIYPNPTTAIINVKSAEEVKSICVFNVNGQQVLRADNATSIDMRGLLNGTYIVRVDLGNGNVATRTVILSK